MGNIATAGFGPSTVDVNSGGTNKAFMVRRGTAADWASINPVLLLGEMGAESDTGAVKVGDGSTAWSSLPLAFATPGTNAWLKRDLDSGQCRLVQPFTTPPDVLHEPPDYEWLPITAATVLWSDGTTGQFTGTRSTTFDRFVQSFTITYVGANGTRTVTQPTITHNVTTGAIISKPTYTYS